MSRPDHSVSSEHYIEATESLVQKPLRVLKDGDLFAVFNSRGNANESEMGPEGLYFRDTRFQSQVLLTVGGKRPLLLGSMVLEDNGALVVDMTNADLHDEEDDRLWLPRDTVFINRLKFLSDNVCYDRISLRRYGLIDRPIDVSLNFACDFADVFEIRGEKRPARGKLHSERIDDRTILFRYVGLDNLERSTTIWLEPVPDSLTENTATWRISLSDEDRCSFLAKTSCLLGEEPLREPPHHVSAFRAYRRQKTKRTRKIGAVSSSNSVINEAFDRAAADIGMLLTDTEYGPYPYAGVPWFSTIFGRDGIITAMQLLWLAPEIARGVLRVLSDTQAIEANAETEAEPGKIIHEMRHGEMARMKEVPFRHYYGSVDATPLYVWLAGEYLQQTGDLEAIREIWPNLQAALAWIDKYGDPDGDGFVEYERRKGTGALTNQGWKDSVDSIFHANGKDAQGAIALCEVQAYVFAAKLAGAQIARALGEEAKADELVRESERLRELFEEQFWLEDLGTYALALDGDKRPCRVRSSNAGHALAAGIASADRARRVAELLMSRQFYTGWGIRTIASGEVRYNPMSYHNGSVWPHDNALIAMGFARYGLNEHASRLLGDMMDAAAQFDLRRLPELFCGFTRRVKRGPTPYPVACAPQAWAAAAPFALLKASIGLDLDRAEGNICLDNPTLPPQLEELTLPGLTVGGSKMSLNLTRIQDDVATEVVQRSGPARLIIRR